MRLLPGPDRLLPRGLIMRTALFSLLSLAVAALAAPADDAIAPDTLAAVKRATVFLKVDVKGLSGSGSGFVVQRDGETALVVTNLHVIEPRVQLDARPRPKTGPKGPKQPPPGLTPRSILTTLKNAAVTII